MFYSENHKEDGSVLVCLGSPLKNTLHVEVFLDTHRYFKYMITVLYGLGTSTTLLGAIQKISFKYIKKLISRVDIENTAVYSC
jgi:hypothetical protein